MPPRLDFLGTILSVFFNYAGPFFLKRIIDAIDSGDPDARARAYLFAVLMFVAQICKSEVDIQKLWHGRRAEVRTRSSLMSAIYEKALKRKDFSGIVNKEKPRTGEETKKDKKERQEKMDKEDEPKSGADIGKIVNLMAGDSSRISTVNHIRHIVYFEFNAELFYSLSLRCTSFTGLLLRLCSRPYSSTNSWDSQLSRASVHSSLSGRSANTLRDVPSGYKRVYWLRVMDVWQLLMNC